MSISPTPQIFLIDDDHDLRHALEQSLELDGFEVSSYSRAAEALPQIHFQLFGIVVCDVRMPEMSGPDFLKKVIDIDPALPVIFITGHGDVAMAVSAMRDGAYDFIEKPFPTSQLSLVINRAVEKRRLVLENRVLREEIESEDLQDETLIGRSPHMVQIRQQVKMLGDADIDVMVNGETGAGKDMVARALHEHSARKHKPFVAVNCGALPGEIIESELFGHEAGAFTGASQKRIGKIEYANGGTLFLDEIESMPLDLQVKLLRVVETRSVERLGSNKSIPLDIRIVAASKVDLAEASAAGEFRQDLYFRLNVASINLLPLRERTEDTLMLFYRLARQARARFRKEIPELTPDLVAALHAHDWPGNVRELRNCADRFVLGMGLGLGEEAAPVETNASFQLSDQMARFEKSVIAQEIARHNGALKPTYEALGISRKTLYDKMKKYGLDAENAATDV
ncbi:sigma-54-dependent transcriptional regulator [Maritalea mediterranea]|uniref:Sigma-54 dependent transcriptional regulator n=1 Tax=Maritalea mediterranea TaxID=2909667 RepID=A0ABS9E4V5_9HYPH|nr:sigma-54 dependent transcriptional regulator [Maritalea mediterranea]MCF4097222.1 sigma-54 dependent transcriptional regulator [Maritalea mediterranea]